MCSRQKHKIFFFYTGSTKKGKTGGRCVAVQLLHATHTWRMNNVWIWQTGFWSSCLSAKAPWFLITYVCWKAKVLITYIGSWLQSRNRIYITSQAFNQAVQSTITEGSFPLSPCSTDAWRKKEWSGDKSTVLHILVYRKRLWIPWTGFTANKNVCYFASRE